MILKRVPRFNWGQFSPLHRMAALHQDLDSLFQRALSEPSTTGFNFEGGGPALDLIEDANGLVVKLELPGLKKEDITISLHNEVLTVSGERKQDTEKKEAAVLRRERTYGRFERSVKLPSQVEEEKIKAGYTDGVLTITLPKSEQVKPKQIPVDIK